MKLLTKEEEQAHYRETVKGGLLGGIAGLGLGTLSVFAASKRYAIIRHLTLPMKAFLVTSSGTFAAIVSADKSSRAFEISRHPEEGYVDELQRQRRELEAGKSTYQKAMDLGKENRYGIVGGSWLASMAIALGLVGRSPYLSTTQKIVQARVYAQGLTLAVLIATAAFEIGDKNKGEGRWETVKIIDPNDPEHKRVIDKKIHHESYAGEDQWRDMVEAEEQKLKGREEAAHEHATNKPMKHKQKEHRDGGKQ